MKQSVRLRWRRRRSFIMALLHAGRKQSEIAKRIGISRGRVQQIVASEIHRAEAVGKGFAHQINRDLLDVEHRLMLLCLWKKSGALKPYTLPSDMESL